MGRPCTRPASITRSSSSGWRPAAPATARRPHVYVASPPRPFRPDPLSGLTRALSRSFPAWRVQWVVAARKRAHSHDIRALALSPSGLELVSGGVDTTLMVYAPSALEGTPRRVLPIPQRPLVAVARSARLLCCQYPHRVDVWRLGATPAGPRDAMVTGTILPLEKRHRKVVELHPKVRTTPWARKEGLGG